MSYCIFWRSDDSYILILVEKFLVFNYKQIVSKQKFIKIYVFTVFLYVKTRIH